MVLPVILICFIVEVDPEIQISCIKWRPNSKCCSQWA